MPYLYEITLFVEENWKQKFIKLGAAQIAVAHLENPAADYSAKQFSLIMVVNLTARTSLLAQNLQPQVLKIISEQIRARR